MRDVISDFNSMEGNSQSNSVKRNYADSNSNDGNSITILPGLGQANSIPIPALDLELARKSNSGAELSLALAYTRLSQITPASLLQPFHPGCTLFFPYLPRSSKL